jgi:hypothetical protein
MLNHVERSALAGKVIGKRKPARGLSSQRDGKEHARAWRRAFPTPFVPKGVYRFRSHEEADLWLWMMITRMPTNHPQASRPSPASLQSKTSSGSAET